MQPPDEKERLIESLAEREEACFHSGEMSDSTTLGIQAELETLQDQLRELPPAETFREEPACERALDAVKAIGRDPSFTTRQQLEGLHAAQHAPTSATAPNTATDLGTLGQYRLLLKLGEGGMGAVYKALHTRLDKVVALKVLTASRLQDHHAVSRFDREMRAVGKLHHVNIVAAHDAGEIDGTHYLVMELVEGIDLGALVKQRGRLPIGAACELIRQAALGLQHAHEHNLVHRDIKPSNLMLTLPKSREETPTVKVLDLGLALLDDSHLESAGELTTTGQVMGTLEYMAPEQGTDTHTVDIRADIYSLGASLYKLLTGKAPFPGEQYRSPIKLLMASATQEPPPVSKLCPEITPEVAAVIHRMLAKKPDDRYATPREVANTLAPFSQPADVWALIEFLQTAPADERVDVNGPTFVGPSNSTKVFVEDKPTQPLISAPTVIVAPVTAIHPQLPQKIRRTGLLTGVCTALGLLIVAAIYVITVRAGQEEIVVHSDHPGISVNIKREGKEIVHGWSLIEGKDNKRRISTGQIEIELPADLTGEFTVTPSTVTVIKGKQQIVKIERKELPSLITRVAQQPSLPEKITPPPADRDRTAAEWWIAHGGTGIIVQHSGVALMIKSGTVLPDTPFHFRGAYVPPPDLVSEDLQHFAGLDDILDLGVHGSQVNATSIQYISQIPRLRNLLIHRTSLKTSDLSGLSKIPFLGTITLGASQVNDHWEFLSNLESLGVICIYGYRPALEDFQRWGDFQQLREIRLHDCQKPDVAWVEQLQQKNPSCRVIVTGAQELIVGKDPVEEAVRTLAPHGLKLYQDNGAGDTPPLTTDSFLNASAPIRPVTLVIPPQSHLDAKMLDPLKQISVNWLIARDRQHADQLVANLPEMTVGAEIDLVRSDLTDAGLRRLQRLAPFDTLNVHGTKVTQAGIEAFQQVRPMCRIISSHGTRNAVFPATTSSVPNLPISDVVDRERAAVELWQQHGGGGAVRLRHNRDRYMTFTADSPVGAAPFDFVFAWGNPHKGFTNSELEHFTGLAGLQVFSPIGEGLDARAIDYLKEMPSVSSFLLLQTRIPSSALSGLHKLPHLGQLWISGTMVDDNWGFVEKLPRLRKLWISQLQPTPTDLRRLAELTQLREIRFLDAGDLDAAAVADLQRKNPQCRLLTSKPNLRTFGADPVRDCVRQLVNQPVTVILVPFDGVGSLKPAVSEAVDDPQPFNFDGLELPADFKADPSMLKLLSDIPIHNFGAANLRNADSLVAVLPADMLNNNFGLAGSDLTDAGLAHLHRYSQLLVLNVLNTKVTRQGVDAFRKAVPFCEVISDFGRFPADFSSWKQKAPTINSSK